MNVIQLPEQRVQHFMWTFEKPASVVHRGKPRALVFIERGASMLDLLSAKLPNSLAQRQRDGRTWQLSLAQREGQVGVFLQLLQGADAAVDFTLALVKKGKTVWCGQQFHSFNEGDSMGWNVASTAEFLTNSGFGWNTLTVDCCISAVCEPVVSRSSTVSDALLQVVGDVALLADSESILADRCMLAARSAVFAQQLTQESNSSERKLVVDNVTAPVLRAILKAIYQGASAAVLSEAPLDLELKRQFLEQLLTAAVRYELRDLVELCSASLASAALWGQQEARAAAIKTAHKLRLPLLEVQSHSVPDF